MNGRYGLDRSTGKVHPFSGRYSNTRGVLKMFKVFAMKYNGTGIVRYKKIKFKNARFCAFFWKGKNARKRSFFRPLGASLPARVVTGRQIRTVYDK